MHPSPRLLGSLVLTFATFASGVESASALTIFSDTTFNNADYDDSLHSVSGSYNNALAVQQTQGGNDVMYVLLDSEGAPNFIDYFTHYNQATYTPTASGAIDSVTFDVSATLQGQSLAYYFAVQQGGKNYVSSTFLQATSPTSVVSSTLQATDFYEQTGSHLSQNPLSNPDFSATGGEIRFGFEFFSGSSSGRHQGEAAFDDLSVSVTQVPEPTTWALLTLMGVFGLSSRRRATASS
jgi:PEP-CTERM motif